MQMREKSTNLPVKWQQPQCRDTLTEVLKTRIKSWYPKGVPSLDKCLFSYPLGGKREYVNLLFGR